MSVIAYRDGVMCADSRAWSGSHRPIGAKRKVHALDDGTLIGVVSTIVGFGERLVEWGRGGFSEAEFPDPECEPDFGMLVVKPSGDVYYYDNCRFPTGPLEAPFFALGSGGSYALGAMHAGANAEEAIHAAIKLDTVCDYPLHKIERTAEGPIFSAIHHSHPGVYSVNKVRADLLNVR